LNLSDITLMMITPFAFSMTCTLAIDGGLLWYTHECI
jgi:hypothetical protein